MEAAYLSMLVLCLLPMTILAYENGAGIEGCYNLQPIHNTTAQNTSSPFAVDVSVNKLVAGQSINVTLRMTSSPSEPYFEGFLVQARCVSCAYPDATILPGTFTVIDAGAKPMTCGAANDSITHTDDEHRTTVTFNWMPPANLNLNQGVQFRAVIARNLERWWTNIRSVALSTTPIATSMPATMPTNAPTAMPTKVSTAKATKTTPTTGSSCCFPSLLLLLSALLFSTLYWF